MAGGVAMAFSATKQVTLVVDGRRESIATTSSSVHDLLTGEGISLASGLQVVPPPATSLADGMTVIVSPAPGIPGAATAASVSAPVIPVDPPVGVWVTEAAGGGHAASAATPDGTSVPAAGVGTSPVVAVRVVVAGKVHDVRTNATDAGALLSAMGIHADADDRVSLSPTTPLHDGALIRFDRVSVADRQVTRAIPPGVRVRYTDDLPAGEIRVKVAGVDGEALVTYRVVRINGRVASRTELGRWIVRSPKTELRTAGEGTPDAHIAMAPDPGVRTQEGLASWYDPPWSGLTAAHPSIPMGTYVTVTEVATSRSVRVLIDDRGPFAEGKIIDLSPEAFAALQPLGRGVLQVRIDW
jgi:uncharacterized protein YabE (DUF348 family)